MENYIFKYDSSAKSKQEIVQVLLEMLDLYVLVSENAIEAHERGVSEDAYTDSVIGMMSEGVWCNNKQDDRSRILHSPHIA